MIIFWVVRGASAELSVGLNGIMTSYTIHNTEQCKKDKGNNEVFHPCYEESCPSWVSNSSTLSEKSISRCSQESLASKETYSSFVAWSHPFRALSRPSTWPDTSRRRPGRPWRSDVQSSYKSPPWTYIRNKIVQRTRMVALTWGDTVFGPALGAEFRVWDIDRFRCFCWSCMTVCRRYKLCTMLVFKFGREETINW